MAHLSAWNVWEDLYTNEYGIGCVLDVACGMLDVVPAKSIIMNK